MSQVCPSIPLFSRLAPTPSGYLHIGNAYSFVLTSLFVRASKGTLFLRIDDIDAERARVEYFDDIFSQVEWLGIRIDNGPSHYAEFKQNYSQHLKLEAYEAYLKTLIDQKQVYACSCSRSQVAAAAASMVYPGTCRKKKLGLRLPEHHLRFNTQNSDPIKLTDLQLNEVTIDLPHQMGDFIIKRKGGLPAYQVVSAVEDITSNINFVVRGEDLLTSTASQILLSQKWNRDLNKSTKFLHHPLIAENTQSKLSKSHNSLSLKKMRENGTTKTQIYRFLAQAYGFSSNKITNLEELLEEFHVSELKLKPILGCQI